MQEHPILGRLWIGHSPLLDRQRRPVATRLTVYPSTPEAAVDATALLAVLAEAWPPDPASGRPALLLNLASEPLLRALIASGGAYRPLLELPAFIAAGAALTEPLAAYAAAGGMLVLRGGTPSSLPAALRGSIGQLIVDAPAGVPAAGGPPCIVAGDGTLFALDAAFKRGASAVLGWPFADLPPPVRGRTMPPDVQAVVELIDCVRREEPVDRLEAVLKKDATLAFRLLRYLNSPAFGLTVEIGSMRHAVLLLGYQRLGRWLGVLLASASPDPDLRPVLYAAIRRGLFFEELLRGSDDPEMRGELFLCGVFSLLDRMLRLPFDALLKMVPVPTRVHEALVDGSGPFQPYLELARAIESESLFDIRETAERLLLGPAEVNRALLQTLVVARDVG